MAGIENNVVYGGGFKLKPSSARDIADMQRVSTDVSKINYVGDPEGAVSANPSSLSHDPVSGNLYVKASGTGNTGWSLIGSGGTGDVSGPGSSTDRSFATWNGTAGTDLFDNPNAKIDSSGFMTNTDQPAFYAYLMNNLAAQTGDGTVVTYPFDTLTFQRGGSNFNTSTGVYTIPKTGLWTFTVNPFLFGIDGTNTSVFVRLNAAGAIYRLYELSPTLNVTGEIVLNASWTGLLNITDQVQCEIVVGGVSKNVGLAGGVTLNGFSGRLVC